MHYEVTCLRLANADLSVDYNWGREMEIWAVGEGKREKEGGAQLRGVVFGEESDSEFRDFCRVGRISARWNCRVY
jgi:hypothetical protein